MVKVCCILVLLNLLILCVYTNNEGEALNAFRVGLEDPANSVFQSWDQTLDTPCTWSHVTCNQDTNKVERLDLGSCNLKGPLSPKLDVLKSLKYLSLYNNKINGFMPTELGNLTGLVSMDLYGNNLVGSIPNELGNLKGLIFLRLQDNQLSGQVPGVLASLTNLQVVNLTNNPGLCGWNTGKAC